MNVLIVNAYSAHNKGDAVIVSQMVRLFEERGCSVCVMSDDPGDEGRYGAPVIAPLVGGWPEEGRRFRRLRMLRQLAGRLAAPRRHPALGWADLCVSAGGGYIYDDGSRASRINLLLRLATLRAARLAGPVVLFSQSIGPFASRALERLVARELRRADLVIVREEISREQCRRMGVRRLALCDDVAFAQRPGSAPLPVQDGSVGVTVLGRLPHGGREGADELRRRIAGALATAIDGREREVVVLSQVAVHGRDDDTRQSRELARDLVERGMRARFVDLGDTSHEEACATFGRLDLLVAGRMHSAILALCAGTPVVAVAYLPKTNGVLARLGLHSCVLSPSDAGGQELAQAIHRGLERRDELRRHISAALPEVRSSAERAADLALAAGRGELAA